jgi:hypothetical protein
MVRQTDLDLLDWEPPEVRKQCAGDCDVTLIISLQDLTFTSYPVAFFNCLVSCLSNLLLLAYPSICLAGAPDQCTEFSTSYTLIPCCDSMNRKTAG